MYFPSKTEHLVLLEMLFRELPLSVKRAMNLRVNSKKDTAVIARLVQSWREPSNPISNTIVNTSSNVDFLISAPYADKLPKKVVNSLYFIRARMVNKPP